jgi:hypothetical protein
MRNTLPSRILFVFYPPYFQMRQLETVVEVSYALIRDKRRYMENCSPYCSYYPNCENVRTMARLHMLLSTHRKFFVKGSCHDDHRDVSSLLSAEEVATQNAHLKGGMFTKSPKNYVYQIAYLFVVTRPGFHCDMDSTQCTDSHAFHSKLYNMFAQRAFQCVGSRGCLLSI